MRGANKVKKIKPQIGTLPVKKYDYKLFGHLLDASTREKFL